MFHHYNQHMQHCTVVAYMIIWNLRTQRWQLRSPHGSRQKCVQYGRLLLQLSLQMWTQMLMPLHHIEYHHWKNGKSLEIWISIIWYVGLMEWWNNRPTVWWCNGINVWVQICNDNWRSNLPYWTHFCLDPRGDLNRHLWVLRFQVIICISNYRAMQHMLIIW